MHDQSRRNLRSAFAAMLIAGLLSAPAVAGGPAGTTITYQGLLSNGGSQVDGPTDLEFRLFDQETLGTQIGNAVILNAEPVNNGLLTVDLDFGVNPYTSAQPLWLEVVVAGQPLSRQQVTSAPFSLGTRGVNVDSAGNVGIPMVQPGYKFHVNGDVQFNGAGGGLIDFVTNGTPGIQSDFAGLRHEMFFRADGIYIEADAFNNTSGLFFANNGNFGINTLVPTARLDVGGDIKSSGIVSAKNGAVRLDKLASNSSGVYSSIPSQHIEFLGNNSTEVAALDFLTLKIDVDDRVLLNSTSLKLLGGHDLWVDGGDVGIGTGTPAEKLDVVGNIHASGTVSADAFSSNSPLQLQTAGTTRIFVNDTNGNVGIGTSTPAAALDVNGDVRAGSTGLKSVNGARSLELRTFGSFNDLKSIGAALTINHDSNQNVYLCATGSGNVGIGTTTPAFRLEVNGTAGKPGGGSWSVSSDIRLKKNIQPLNGALDTLLALHGVTFEYKDPEAIHELPGERIGFVAQEVEQVIPDWVEQRADGYKALTIRGFEAMTVEAMRDLSNENAQLRAELNELRTELAELKAAMKQVAETR